MASRTLTLFHTAQTNVALFESVILEIAPGLPRRHVVDEAILREARTAGTITPALSARVDETMADVMRDSAFVLCTCSTIGALAEQNRAHVLRVDRPMAERAVSLGSRVAVAATLPSTLGPTRALLLETATTANRPLEMVDWYLDQAWPFMERQDPEGYAREIARDVSARVGADRVDVVVLAQASMAVAEPFFAELTVPVLSSPRLGVEAALKRLQSL